MNKNNVCGFFIWTTRPVIVVNALATNRNHNYGFRRVGRNNRRRVGNSSRSSSVCSTKDGIPFPSEYYGSRREILQSKEFAEAKRFIEERHYELYKEDCPILGPRIYSSQNMNDDNNNVNKNDDIDGPLDNVDLQQLVTTYKTSPSILSSSKKEYKGFVGFGGSSSSNGATTSSRKRRKFNKQQKKKKWAQDYDDGDKYINGESGVGRGGPILLFDEAEWCHVSKHRMLEAEECETIINEAESESNNEAWRPHEQYGKGKDITKVVEPISMPITTPIVANMCRQNLFPLLKRLFFSKSNMSNHNLRSKHINDICIFKAKVLRYDASNTNTHLGIHHDGSLLTCLISLNDDFEGGGTYIEALGKTIQYPPGHTIIHAGSIRHAGTRITSGKRYILALWLGVPGIIEYDRNFADEGDLRRMNGILSQTIRYDTPTSSYNANSDREEKHEDSPERWYYYSLAAGCQFDNEKIDLVVDENVPPLTSENTWLGLGQLYLDKGRFSEAVSAFRNSIAMAPKNVRAHITYGLALLQQQEEEGSQRSTSNMDLALQMMETACELASAIEEEEMIEAHYNLGLLYNLLGRQKDAVKTYERALECGKKISAEPRLMAELYTNLGVALYDDSLVKDAMSAFATALLFDPNFTDASNNLRALRGQV